MGHLDLQVLGIGQVVDCHAEAPRRYLFHGAVAGVAVRVQLVSVPVFAAFASVAAGVDAVHGDGHGLMRLAADGAKRNCPGGEALDDFFGLFHLIDRDRLGRHLEVQQAPYGAQALGKPVCEFGELPVRFPVVGHGGVLQLRYGVWVPHVVLAVATPLIVAA